MLQAVAWRISLFEAFHAFFRDKLVRQAIAELALICFANQGEIVPEVDWRGKQKAQLLDERQFALQQLKRIDGEERGDD